MCVCVRARMGRGGLAASNCLMYELPPIFPYFPSPIYPFILPATTLAHHAFNA